MTHDLKIETRFYNLLERGLKNYEIRYNDRNFKAGDFLVLNSYDLANDRYSGHYIKCQVLTLLEGFRGLEKNYVAMALKPLYKVTQFENHKEKLIYSEI